MFDNVGTHLHYCIDNGCYPSQAVKGETSQSPNFVEKRKRKVRFKRRFWVIIYCLGFKLNCGCDIRGRYTASPHCTGFLTTG